MTSIMPNRLTASLAPSSTITGSTSISSSTSLRFGSKQDKVEFTTPSSEESEKKYSIATRLKAGSLGAIKEVFNLSKIKKDLLISTLFTVATIWIPSPHHLLTFPVVLSFSAMFRAAEGFMYGYENPEGKQPPSSSGTLFVLPF